MGTSSRDKILMLILPALVVLVGYALLFSLPHYRAFSALEKSLKIARDGQPTQQQVRIKQTKFMELKEEIEHLQLDEKYFAKSWEDLTHACLSAEDRSDRLTRLLALLKMNGVHVIHHGPLEGADAKDLKLSASQERLAKLMNERGNKTPQAWRLHVTGRYGEVVQALQALSTGDPIAIPLGLIMKESPPGNTRHEWWVFLWI